MNVTGFMLMLQSPGDSFPEMNSLLIRDLSLSSMTQTQQAKRVFFFTFFFFSSVGGCPRKS